MGYQVWLLYFKQNKDPLKKMQRRKTSTVCDLVKHEADHGAKQMCFISTAAKQEERLMSSKDHASGSESCKRAGHALRVTVHLSCRKG